jgi:hypothetical protein
MNLLTQQILAASTPSPYPAFHGNTDTITPGWIGFTIIFLVAVATVFLIIDMNRRIRRSRYRAEVRVKLEAEQAEADAAAAAAARKAGRKK